MARKASAERLTGIIDEVLTEFVFNLDRFDPLENAADIARMLIIMRTRAGVDRFGNIFTRYRPSTAQMKGRFSPVTLTESGDMLNRLTVPKPIGHWDRERIAHIRPGTPRDKAILRRHIKGTINMAVRDPFGLTPQEERIVLADVERGLVRRVIPKDRRRIFSIDVVTF